MLAVGEKSGNMGEMMEKIAEFHDEEISRWVDWFARLFEPLLMTAIGLVIGAVFFLCVTPIGLILRLVGKDVLSLRRRADLSSYWIARDPPGPAPGTMTNQF